MWSIFLKNGEWFRSLGSWMPFSTCNRRQISFIGEIHSPDYNPWWSGHRTSICKSAASRVSKWVMQSISLNLPCWVWLTLSVAKGINAMFFLFLLSLHCQSCRRLDALFGWKIAACISCTCMYRVCIMSTKLAIHVDFRITRNVHVDDAALSKGWFLCTVNFAQL